MLDSLKKLCALFGRPEKVKFGILLVMMVVAGFAELAGISVIPGFVAAVAFPDKVLAYPVIGPALQRMGLDSSNSLLYVGGIAVIVVFALKNTYLIFNRYLQARFCKFRLIDLRRRIFSAYVQAPYQFIIRRNTAELLRNANNLTMRVSDMVLMPLLSLGTQLLLTLFIVTLVVIAAPLPGMSAMLILGLAGGGVLWAVRNKTVEFGKTEQREQTISNKTVQQGIGGLKEARVLNCEKTFVKGLVDSARNMATAQMYRRVVQNLGRPVLETVAIVGLLLVAFLVVKVFGQSIEEAVPLLALFAVAFSRLKGALSETMSNYTLLRSGLVSVGPLYEDLQTLERPDIDEHAMKSRSELTALPLRKTIQIRDLTFRYEGADHDALNSVTLDVPRGASVAFVGPSGAGKTTIIDLVLGLLTPKAGRIAVDGVDIQTQLRNWQANIGYIPQFIYLLDDTIRANVAFGIRPDQVNEDMLQQALDAAHIRGFIDTLPEKLDTVIGEHGARLSGGQRQRIGIARALYHNPDVLVMDEATSALDNATEKAVIDSINALKGERTILMIAHRLSTVKDCDQLFHLKDGSLRTQGTYEELMDKDSEFAAMAG